MKRNSQSSRFLLALLIGVFTKTLLAADLSVAKKLSDKVIGCAGIHASLEAFDKYSHSPNFMEMQSGDLGIYLPLLFYSKATEHLISQGKKSKGPAFFDRAVLYKWEGAAAPIRYYLFKADDLKVEKKDVNSLLRSLLLKEEAYLANAAASHSASVSVTMNTMVDPYRDHFGYGKDVTADMVVGAESAVRTLVEHNPGSNGVSFDLRWQPTTEASSTERRSGGVTLDASRDVADSQYSGAYDSSPNAAILCGESEMQIRQGHVYPFTASEGEVPFASPHHWLIVIRVGALPPT